MVSDSPALHSKWLLLLKIEISKNGGVTHNFESGPPKDHFNSNFSAKDFYFSVKFFFQPIYTDYTNYAYFDKRSHLNLLL
jgi:hypothetical protein